MRTEYHHSFGFLHLLVDNGLLILYQVELATRIYGKTIDNDLTKNKMVKIYMPYQAQASIATAFFKEVTNSLIAFAVENHIERHNKSHDKIYHTDIDTSQNSDEPALQQCAAISPASPLLSQF